MDYLQIAIDGPAGAGKSSIAKELAKKFKFIYIDTGAMYRALTLILMEKNINLDDLDKIEKEAEEIDISFKLKDNDQLVFIGDRNVTEEIRNHIVSQKVSAVSAINVVRREMVKKQQRLALGNNVVMDGRDIGTVVLPKAKVKIFLTASADERARRRFLEMKDKGHQIDFNTLVEDIKKRDHMDETREISPLVAAEDSIKIDTTELSFDEVLKKIEYIAKEEIKNV
jgi:cytidylate kinase